MATNKLMTPAQKMLLETCLHFKQFGGCFDGSYLEMGKYKPFSVSSLRACERRGWINDIRGLNGGNAYLARITPEGEAALAAAK